MLKPLEDRIIVKIIENEDTTKSGIILTGTLQDEICYAIVVEVGKGTDKVKIEVKKADKVVIDKDIGTKIKYEGEELLIIKQSNILAIIE